MHTWQSLAEDLARLGLGAGAIVLLHSSYREIGPVEDGAAGVLAAFDATLGPTGTLVVPAFTAGNSLTSRTHRRAVADLSPDLAESYRASMPAFDPAFTPSQEVGAIAEYVRQHGAWRSGHPQTSFAALGDQASWLTADHDPECHFGERSPLRRLYDAGASILLAGVGYEACSAFHLAEYRVPNPPMRQYDCLVKRNGARAWLRYDDVNLDDSDFAKIGADFEENGDESGAVPVTRGRLGSTDARLLPLAAAVDFARAWIPTHRRSL